jgi:hypothetical protein
MTQTTHPPKEVVREYMARRREEENPPPAPETIRTELGWRLIPENGTAPEVPD